MEKPCEQCGGWPDRSVTDEQFSETFLRAVRYRTVLERIGNLVGGPTMTYSPANEIKEWRERAEKISKLVQEALKP